MTWDLVVGSVGGIGSEVARQLLTDGRQVVGVDRRPSPGPAEWEHRTIADGDDTWLAELLAERGAPATAVFAQGIYPRRGFEAYDRAGYAEVMACNFELVFWSLQKILPKMAAAGGGRVVVVSSQAGATGGFDPVYAASKAACNALVKSLAREYGSKQILINAVAPGPVETPMAFAAMPPERIKHYLGTIPIERFTQASEVAATVAFLLKSGQSAIHGATIDIDGWLLRR